MSDKPETYRGVTERTCIACGQIKPISAFGMGRKKYKRHTCRVCVNARNRSYRVKKPECYREYDRQKRGCAKKKRRMRAYRERLMADPERRAILHGHVKKWAALNPEKRAAHAALNYAVRLGRIRKSVWCERCFLVSDRINGHHHDYSKPFEVRWLCATCHGFEHRDAA